MADRRRLLCRSEKGEDVPRRYHDEPSVLTPDNLLREARRQKAIEAGDVPRVCLLDPDGDIAEYLRANARLTLCRHWACYHTELYEYQCDGRRFGIIGCAVGSPFAVLLAEQLFVSGCDLLLSVTSAGIISTPASESRFIVIESAYRDEGTSGHYLPPGDFANLSPALRETLVPVMRQAGVGVGSSWTTDAPYRETRSAIEEAKELGITCVEMEAAALYAFAEANHRPVVCLAHLTNTMAQTEGDFEKGIDNGSAEALEIVAMASDAIMPLLDTGR